MKRVKWGMDAGSVHEKGEMGGVDAGTARKTREMGG